MSNRKIKILKRDAVSAASVAVPEPSVKSERAATSIVMTWVKERRQNENAERLASGSQVFAWKQLPDVSGGSA